MARTNPLDLYGIYSPGTPDRTARTISEWISPRLPELDRYGAGAALTHHIGSNRKTAKRSAPQHSNGLMLHSISATLTPFLRSPPPGQHPPPRHGHCRSAASRSWIAANRSRQGTGSGSS